MEIVLAPAGVQIGVAGVFLFGALIMGLNPLPEMIFGFIMYNYKNQWEYIVDIT